LKMNEVEGVVGVGVGVSVDVEDLEAEEGS